MRKFSGTVKKNSSLKVNETIEGIVRKGILNDTYHGG
jgi:hypothetical protein